MTEPHCRAWRFIQPEQHDDAAVPTGLVISATGGISMVEGHAAVRQAIRLLLSTWPGERVMRPDYGCDLYRLIFSPNDDTTAGLAIHYIRQALERWEPRIEICNLDAHRREDDPSYLDIYLDYRVRPAQHTEQLVFAMNLTGA